MVQRLELRIPPLALCAAFAVAMIAATTLMPDPALHFRGQSAIAIAALLLGIVVGVAGIVEFRRAQTTVNPLQPGRASSVVVSGIYRVTRNPMYLGMAMALFGVAAWTSTLLGYALVPVFCAYMTQFQIKPEERALLALFGDSFAAYMAQVRRWV